ncbi:MAG: hypothetical protein JWO28_131 [Hyphomicrobiales bacterium]|nr:hypothetical protein [Hyphomicrobiales bacterium]
MTLDLTAFGWFHSIISLVAIIAGIVVVKDLLASKADGPWSLLYFVTAVATSVTGFGFPFTQFLPSHGVGVLSLIILIAAILARYVFHYAGPWRWIYAVGVTLGEYFLVFVLIAQAFSKVNALHALAPTQSEPPFAVAQLILLAIFVVLTIAAVRKFRPAVPPASLARA